MRASRAPVRGRRAARRSACDVPAQVVGQPVHVGGELRVALQICTRGCSPAARRASSSAGLAASQPSGRRSASAGGSAPHHSSNPAGVTRNARSGSGGSSAGQPSSCSASAGPACAAQRCACHGLRRQHMVDQQRQALRQRTPSDEPSASIARIVGSGCRPRASRSSRRCYGRAIRAPACGGELLSGNAQRRQRRRHLYGVRRVSVATSQAPTPSCDRLHVRRPQLQTHLLQRAAIGDVAGCGLSRADDHRARATCATALGFGEPIDAPRPDAVPAGLRADLPGPQPLQGQACSPPPPTSSRRGSTLLAILALCAYATNSLQYFEHDVLLAWAVVTPLLQWLAMCDRPHGSCAASARSAREPRALGRRRRRRPAGREGRDGARRRARRGASTSSAGSTTAPTSAWTTKPRGQHARRPEGRGRPTSARTASRRSTSRCRWARSRASSSCSKRCRAPPRRSSSCPTSSASASSRAGCRT